MYWLIFLLIVASEAKYQQWEFKEETRMNVLLTKFGFVENGTLFVQLINFTVPEPVITSDENQKPDRYGIIGFTFSRNEDIATSTFANPHLCQLNQKDQQLDAIFLVFDFETSSLTMIKSGKLKDIDLCHTVDDCFMGYNNRSVLEPERFGFIDKYIRGKKAPTGTPLKDYIPLQNQDGQYSAQFAIRFNSNQTGMYYFIYHNCFSYRQQGFSDKVAVNFKLNIMETNLGSHLSAGDIPKPRIYLVVSFLAALASIMWVNTLCKSDSKSVFRVHYLMLALIILKTMSTFCHGMNYYFVSLYGQQREIWAIIYYITHLLKGALLFGTLILIGTGYTFFKHFLTDRERNLFMIILPLQVMDNIILVILNESDVVERSYMFYWILFMVVDLICCLLVLFPLMMSMKHLQQGALTDGKAMFNVEKLQLFKRFYLSTVLYLYTTRGMALLMESQLPFDQKWTSEAISETVTLAFFVLVGYTFRPVRTNPYLKLSQDDYNEDEESGMAITQNGLYENVIKLNRVSTKSELLDDEDSASDEENTKRVGLA